MIVAFQFSFKRSDKDIYLYLNNYYNEQIVKSYHAKPFQANARHCVISAIPARGGPAKYIRLIDKHVELIY
jgi:hypothetical protein